MDPERPAKREATAPSQSGERCLESWKEIGAYLQRNAVTARRWEKEEGLPVHRHPHKIRSSVYAYPSELDSWRLGRRVVAEPAPVVRTWWRPVGFAVTTLLCLMMVGNGPRRADAARRLPLAPAPAQRQRQSCARSNVPLP